MSADDLSHRAAAVTGGSTDEREGHGTAVGPAVGLDAVAARVPLEYRDAYLEGVARVRKTRHHVAA